MANDNTPTAPLTPVPLIHAALLQDLRTLIAETRVRVAHSVNCEMVLLNWHVGQRIHQEITGGQRATYGHQILRTLSASLTAEFGKGYTVSGLSRMITFVELFPDREIVATLSQQLSWSHFVELLGLKDTVQREFYSELCRVEQWSVRVLRDQMQGMLYERTAISRRPDDLVRQELASLLETDYMNPDMVFRDPYLLVFLGLADTFSERELESAILRELERFLLELGSDFSFMVLPQ